MRERVEVSLRKLNRTIIVIVDDLDRLPSNEIRLMFQAIKAVANFPRITYLVAYDPAIVDRALNSEDYGGPKFREKIIQAIIPLPHIHLWDRELFIAKQIRTVIYACLGEEHRIHEELFEQSIPIIAHICRSPRDMIRLCNSLRLALFTIGPNINVADIAVIEAILLKYPEFRNVLRQYYRDFTGTTHHLDRDPFGLHDKFRKAEINPAHNKAWMNHIPDNIAMRGPIISACEFLFEDTLYTRSGAAERRIRDPNLLALFNSLGPSEGVPSPDAIESMLNSPARFLEESKKENFYDTLQWIARYPPSISLADVPATLDAMSQIAQEYCGEENQQNIQIRLLGDILTNIIRAVSSQVDRRSFLLQLTEKAPLSLTMTPIIEVAQVYNFQLSEKSHNKPPLLDRNYAQEAFTNWLQAVEKSAKDRVLYKEPRLHNILYYYGSNRFIAPSAARGITKDLCRGTVVGLLSFCAPFKGLHEDHLDATSIANIVWNPSELAASIESAGRQNDYPAFLKLLNRADYRQFCAERHQAQDLEFAKAQQGSY